MIFTDIFALDQVRDEIRKSNKKIIDNPFGVNLVMIHREIKKLNKMLMISEVEIITCVTDNSKIFEYMLDESKKYLVRVIKLYEGRILL